METIRLRDDDHALDLIRSISAGEVSPTDIKLDFSDWPKYTIHLTGEKYHQSITPSVMKGFLELQKTHIGRMRC